MKKMLLVILLVFSFYNVFASSLGFGDVAGGTKYEVTYLKTDKCENGVDICVDIEGWAILSKDPDGSRNQSGVKVTGGGNTFDYNGDKFFNGYCIYGSKPYKNNKGNIIDGTGVRNEDYLYQYKLSVYDDKGNLLGDSQNNSSLIKFTRRSVSLTYLQSVKEDNDARFGSGLGHDRSSCYEDVGFKFVVNISKLSPSANKISFKLTISNGRLSDYKKSETVNISVVEASNPSTSSSDISMESLIDTVSYVKNYMLNGYTWETANKYNTKSSSYAITHSTKVQYEVFDTKLIDGVSWYEIKVNGAYRWIPASWTEPVASRATIITTDIQDKEPDSCKKNTSGLPVKKECEKCADSVTINTDDIENCKSLETETDFYEITCTDDITTSFNPDNLNLKRGQGFYYGIDVVSSRECEGKFNGEKWLEAYNIAITNRKKYENSPSDYERNETKLNDLLNVVDSYNNYVMEDKNNPTATIDINYYVNEKKKILNYNFASEVVNDGVGEFTEKNTINLNIAGLTNPSNFKYSNKSNKRHVRLFPPKVYLEKNTGEIVTSSHKNKINGGNKFYTAIDSDLREFYLEIKVNNLGKNGKSSILNKKCSGLLYDVKEQYRIIDTSNPFINAERYKNTNNNWKNNDYDFTKTIGNNNGILYSFSLTNSDISEIKSDNIKNWNSYLGTCYNNISEMSPIFKRICETINSK